MDLECLSAQGCKFEHTRQRNDVLTDWSIVPVKRRISRRLLKKDGFRLDQFASTHAASYHKGISVRAGI